MWPLSAGDGQQSLLAARQVVGRKMQRGANFSSPVDAKVYLTAKSAASSTGCLQSCFRQPHQSKQGFTNPSRSLSQQRRHQQPHNTVCSSRWMRAPNRLVAHVTLDDSVALDVGKVCFAVGWRKG
jgi:hypothetical protein